MVDFALHLRDVPVVLRPHWRRFGSYQISIGAAVGDESHTGSKGLSGVGFVVLPNPPPNSDWLMLESQSEAGHFVAHVPVHGFETADCAYAANAIGVSCSARTAAGGLKPCRSMSHSVL